MEIWMGDVDWCIPNRTISGMKKPSRKPATGPSRLNSQTMPSASHRPPYAPMGANTSSASGTEMTRESMGTRTIFSTSGMNRSMKWYTMASRPTPKITGNTESA